ncbi:hypothetical protein H8E52_08915 [bacterium]|nr:hypothetical protein [bacterium]
MPDRPNILIVAMGHGGLAPLLRELDGGLRKRGLDSLVWAMGGSDGGIDFLRGEGLSAFAPLRDHQILNFLDKLPDTGYLPEHPRMQFYRAFEQGASPEARIGCDGLILIARWGMFIREQAMELLDLMQPAAMLVQSGVRLVEGVLADLAIEREIPLLFMEKGAFPSSVLVDEQGVGPLSLYGDPGRWESAGRKLTIEEQETLDAFRRRFRNERTSAWEQPSGGGDLHLQLGLKKKQRILFVPGQVRHDANTVLYSPCYPDNESFLRHLLAASEGLDLFIVAKPHPKESRDEAHLAQMLKGRGAWLPELNVHDALEAADLVACLNSTVGLEALVYGKPVICGAHAFWAGKEFSFDLLEDGGHPALREFLANAPAPEAKLLDPFLHHLLSEGSYGEAAGPWPNMDALAERLAGMAEQGGGDFEAAGRWMAETEARALARQEVIPADLPRRRLLPFFD